MANEPPKYDVAQICRGGSGQVITYDECVKSEQEAHAQLEKQWADFNRSNTADCIKETTLPGGRSYVELLTCLQIAKREKTAPPDPFGPLPVIEKDR